MSKHFAVIGNPIGHSLSPFIHKAFAAQVGMDLTYEKILGEEASFEQQVLNFLKKGLGMNVTMPFKQKAYNLAKWHSDRAQKAAAANTLWVENGQLHADNTDGIGLVRDLKLYLDLLDKKVLILGAGGAARGIIYPLLSMKPQSISVATRSEESGISLLKDFPEIKALRFTELREEYDLIINATSASIEGQSIELPGQLMKMKPFCYDLGYANQGITPFVSYAKSLDCPAKDGIGMLVEQAAEAFLIWNGIMPDTSKVLKEIQKI